MYSTNSLLYEIINTHEITDNDYAECYAVDTERNKAVSFYKIHTELDRGDRHKKGNRHSDKKYRDILACLTGRDIKIGESAVR